MNDFKTPEEKKLEDALADSALKTLRILELEKELAAARKDKKETSAERAWNDLGNTLREGDHRDPENEGV